MCKHFKLFFTAMALMPSFVHAAKVHNASDSLKFDVDGIKASMSQIKMKHVHGDFIHQVIYLEELADDMNRDLSTNFDLSEVKRVADELNDTISSNSVGFNLVQIPISQQSYYHLPTDASSDTLGRKAVATAIFEQYTLNQLEAVDKALTVANLGSISQFIESNQTAYQQLANLTTQFYSQARNVKKIEMNFAFDYEQSLLAHYSQPLKKFYK
ncbi:hypothetical protein JQC92_10110 [Shewanella sp. 202IG2-18]|uniref:hypothetical protein n=1 Tax=Parashewanella hymeniacidonis TaxID=2807618 RepID=UPI001960AD5E|nr:hypothetical protein [Parashewanella hymeniacidonis]MBM7072382.1 hypothetical protein [Parashewanella hymeniacidonis]